MHRVGLVHRDLKLMNVFMVDTSAMPRVKIGDLGLSCKLKNDETIIKKAGTYAFMAPEVILNQPADFKSDVWSLGMILYTIIASRLPFASDFYTESKVKQMLKMDIPFEGSVWEQTNPDCVDLLRGMLSHDQC